MPSHEPTEEQRWWLEAGRREGRLDAERATLEHDAPLIDALIGAHLEHNRRTNVTLWLACLASFALGLGIGLAL